MCGDFLNFSLTFLGAKGFRFLEEFSRLLCVVVIEGIVWVDCRVKRDFAYVFTFLEILSGILFENYPCQPTSSELNFKERNFTDQVTITGFTFISFSPFSITLMNAEEKNRIPNELNIVF